MRFYKSTQRFLRPLSYVGKMLVICFIGMHVPLIGLCVWAYTFANQWIPVGVFVIVLVATLIGTFFTLWALQRMLRPIAVAATALEAYEAKNELPKLPIGYEDEAGRLMSSVQRTLTALDGRIDEISRLAMTDGLTNVRNRRWMMEVGIPLFEKRLGSEQEMSLLVIDLDEFKSVNDHWGHSVGDQILLSVANAICASVRETDDVVRTGGDEFCVFLPSTLPSMLDEIAERVRANSVQTVQNIPFEKTVTISIGVATSQKGDKTFSDVYRRADQHLYAAKNAGRNLVVSEMLAAPASNF